VGLPRGAQETAREEEKKAEESNKKWILEKKYFNKDMCRRVGKARIGLEKSGFTLR